MVFVNCSFMVKPYGHFWICGKVTKWLRIIYRIISIQRMVPNVHAPLVGHGGEVPNVHAPLVGHGEGRCLMYTPPW